MAEHATKTRIKETALKLFARKGVAETTTRDLAVAADIAEGTIYRHYGSKEELVQDLFVEHYSAFSARIRASKERERSTRKRLAAVVRDACALFDKNPALYRFLLLIQHEALPRIPKGDNNPLVALAEIVAEGIEAGEVTIKEAPFGAAMILGLLIQPALGIIHGSLAPPLSDYAAEIASAAFRVLNR